MNQEYIEISTLDILPGDEKILTVIYKSKTESPDSNTVQSLRAVKKLFIKYAHPIGKIRPVSKTMFSNIYAGKGLNASISPLEFIFSQSDFLHLFVATTGSDISEKITNIINRGDYLDGYILDAIASLATDRIIKIFENRVNKSNTKTLSYSPGYCGWHVSGQHALLQYVRAHKIGITLNKQALMNPIKSVSGVLVSGQHDIHKFKPDFSFCKKCIDHSCLPRMK